MQVVRRDGHLRIENNDLQAVVHRCNHRWVKLLQYRDDVPVVLGYRPVRLENCHLLPKLSHSDDKYVIVRHQS